MHQLAMPGKPAHSVEYGTKICQFNNWKRQPTYASQRWEVIKHEINRRIQNTTFLIPYTFPEIQCAFTFSPSTSSWLDLSLVLWHKLSYWRNTISWVTSYPLTTKGLFPLERFAARKATRFSQAMALVETGLNRSHQDDVESMEERGG
jgi:hypothetical protein